MARKRVGKDRLGWTLKTLQPHLTSDRSLGSLNPKLLDDISSYIRN